jgi:hypothetical protein
MNRRKFLKALGSSLALFPFITFESHWHSGFDNPTDIIVFDKPLSDYDVRKCIVEYKVKC